MLALSEPVVFFTVADAEAKSAAKQQGSLILMVLLQGAFVPDSVSSDLDLWLQTAPVFCSRLSLV
jgi:hypothetical protein